MAHDSLHLAVPFLSAIYLPIGDSHFWWWPFFVNNHSTMFLSYIAVQLQWNVDVFFISVSCHKVHFVTFL